MCSSCRLKYINATKSIPAPVQELGSGSDAEEAPLQNQAEGMRGDEPQLGVMAPLWDEATQEYRPHRGDDSLLTVDCSPQNESFSSSPPASITVAESDDEMFMDSDIDSHEVVSFLNYSLKRAGKSPVIKKKAATSEKYVKAKIEQSLPH